MMVSYAQASGSAPVPQSDALAVLSHFLCAALLPDEQQRNAVLERVVSWNVFNASLQWNFKDTADS